MKLGTGGATKPRKTLRRMTQIKKNQALFSAFVQVSWLCWLLNVILNVFLSVYRGRTLIILEAVFTRLSLTGFLCGPRFRAFELTVASDSKKD